ncbi:MAG: hypothetical protein COB07_06115 [Sulfurovum sp.]|nr:MAG: hypothetical protein COB07_06115 [Sulfurovum sp.]
MTRAGLSSDNWNIISPKPGTLLRSGESLWLFRTKSLEKNANEIIAAFSKLELRLQYSSLYKEKQPVFSKYLAGVDQVIKEDPLYENA